MYVVRTKDDPMDLDLSLKEGTFEAIKAIIQKEGLSVDGEPRWMLIPFVR